VALDHREHLLDIERLADVTDCSARLNGDSNSVAENCCDQSDRRVTATVAVGQTERRAGASWHGEISFGRAAF
jgi:hypothetical protein